MIDIAIIGGGPAGLSAAIYAARAGRKTHVYERAWTGGLIFQASIMENYPGIKSIGGPDFSQILEEQAKEFGAVIVNTDVIRVELAANPKLLHLANGTVVEAGAVILALGAQPKLLGVPGEQEFSGRGVSYCATCDGRFFKEKKVAVIGSGDMALEEALFLSRMAAEVVAVFRSERLRATKILQERVQESGNIMLRPNSMITEIHGGSVVHSITLKDTQSEQTENLEVAGVFIYEGYKSNSELVQGQINLDDNGQIITDADTMETNLPGVYAAGDIRRKVLRQVVSANADGAVAAVMADRWLDFQVKL